MQQENGIIKAIFFGNFFYGICAITLSIEAALQQLVPLNPVTYYILLFAATVLYYTKAYISVNTADPNNKRSVWYVAHKKAMVISQIVLSIVFVMSGCLLLGTIWRNVLQITIHEWLIIMTFPVVAALYYGINLPYITAKNLRNIGWLKPFFIGFVWAGLVTVYPVMFNHISNNTLYTISWVSCLLFVKNCMFVTVLCIMFDIKDYAADYNQQLKTFVVRVGLRKTIFSIIMPLSVIGLGTFITFAIIRHFPLLRIVINTVPFILLLAVAYSLHRRKSILYYLAIIDGLLLVKSICGIIGISFIK